MISYTNIQLCFLKTSSSLICKSLSLKKKRERERKGAKKDENQGILRLTEGTR